MLFSIIIPVYNVEPYLRQSLDSVLKQNYSDYEVIAINDGSTDNGLSILQEYQEHDRRIKIIDQENKGLSAARNAGMKEATGEYLLLLDSDDWLEPHTLQTLADKQNGEDMICFNGKRYFEDGREEIPDQGITEERLTGWDYYSKYALIPRKFHFVCTVLRLYKREFLLQNKLFFKEGILHEDNLFTPIACYFSQSVQVIPDILYTYRIREGSITQKNSERRVQDMITITNQLSLFFISKNGLSKKTIYNSLSDSYIDLFNWFLEIYNNDRNSLGNFYHSILWPAFYQVSESLMQIIYYHLLHKKKFNLFKILYYYNVCVFNKILRKITMLKIK